MRHATCDMQQKRAAQTCEKLFLQKIEQQFGKSTSAQDPLLVQGIGDDAAVFRGDESKLWLATCDAQVEGVHFNLDWISFNELGARSFHVAVSDIAAMGGVPRFVLLSLIVPDRVSQADVSKMMIAFNGQARKEKVQLIGGNLSSSLKHLSIDVFVLGQVDKGQSVLRSGAKPGDTICTTGFLGHAAAGLALLTKFGRTEEAKANQKLVFSFLRPRARIAAGKVLAQSGLVSSMMDVSDGLSSDLKSLCAESKVGAQLGTTDLPMDSALVRAGKLLNCDPLQWVLHGGEDYELLFTLKSSATLTQIDQLKRKLATPIHEIGKITAGKAIVIGDENGKLKKLESKGWDHFR